MTGTLASKTLITLFVLCLYAPRVEALSRKTVMHVSLDIVASCMTNTQSEEQTKYTVQCTENVPYKVLRYSFHQTRINPPPSSNESHHENNLSATPPSSLYDEAYQVIEIKF